MQFLCICVLETKFRIDYVLTFLLILDYHDYNTRSASNYHLPKVRTMVSKHSIFYKGPIIWNYLTLEIRKSPTLNTFKRKLKITLLENL